MTGKTEATDKPQAATQNTVGGRPCVTVTLETPIKREGGDLAKIQIIKPQTGDLRGVSLVELMQMNTDAIVKVLPRVSHPSIVPHEVKDMDITDVLQVGTELVNFLLPASARDQAGV
ncbi:phage tail assembly protein [Delftia tsuruhatensis]|jgi:hypothetical protein|uniref:phage tail assembly protein n=1 Tax=Delftia TaxID=80865 RepID=UPI0009DF4DB4|nr:MULTISPECIES: phage tail assembly protein [Delftia]KAA9181544.1 phage tail assembly protein [Delftia sp. BR1]MDH0777135.1 phage tail assembly protein [Delftia tsuruhatensis]MDH1461179.1 phage tail assembly protein [Delftia tsuruhatensis]WGG09023.1 phage tail assembly protein [Delftia tsuruhatensis]